MLGLVGEKVWSCGTTVASNDADDSPFDITLAGMPLAAETDANRNGVINAAEVKIVTLSFDPLTDNTPLRTRLQTTRS